MANGGGAEVDLSGNNSKLNAASEQSGKKMVQAAESGGKAFNKVFTDAEVGFGKMIAKAFVLKKVMDGFATATLAAANAKAATSETYGGQRFEAELAASKANIGMESANVLLRGGGAATAADRVGLLQALGSSPMDRYSTQSKDRDKTFDAVSALFRTGLVSQEEAITAFHSGESGIAYLQSLVNKRKGDFSQAGQAEYATRQAVEAQNRIVGGDLDAGNRERIITAGVARNNREHPNMRAIADGLGLGAAADAGARGLESTRNNVRTLGASKEVAVSVVDMLTAGALRKPNYSASDGK